MRLIDADALKGPIELQRASYERIGAAERAEAYANVLWEIDEAPTVGGWVSVKDRLPKDGQDVLAYLNDGEETRIAPCHYFNDVWFDSVMNCVVVHQDVTHWMPLPEPPKEDNNEGS